MVKTTLLFLLFFITSEAFAKKNGYQMAGYLGISLLNQSTEATVATDGVNFFPANVVSTYENSPSGGLEMRSVDSDSWLTKIGAKTMPYRKITAAELQITGQGKQMLTILNPYSYKLTTIYLTTGYCWQDFYLMLGLTYNIFDVSLPAATTPYRTKNGSGAVFGFGVKADDHWSVEYVAYSAAVSIESGTNYETKDALIFSDAVLSLNYGF